MYNPSYVALVDAHAEGNCGAYDLCGAVEERSHRLVAVLGAHAGMIAHRPESCGRQSLVHPFGAVAGETIAYAGVLGIFAHQTIDKFHTVARTDLIIGAKRDIRAVEGS